MKSDLGRVVEADDKFLFKDSRFFKGNRREKGGGRIRTHKYINPNYQRCDDGLMRKTND